MGLNNKIKWVLGITVVFVIILATNLIDRNNFLRVKDSVSSVYADRMVAKDIIVDVLKIIHQKELANAKNDKAVFSEANVVFNANVNTLISRFEQTKLIKEEKEIFEDFKNNFKELESIESNNSQMLSDKSSELISEIKLNLYALSKIQLAEGRRQIGISNKAIDSVELFTNLEIYVLIFLGILIQILVIYTPKRKED